MRKGGCGTRHSVWTLFGLSDRAATLARHGETADLIANTLSKEYEVEVTRNMVCGRMYRLGIAIGPRNNMPRKLRPEVAATIRRAIAKNEIAPTFAQAARTR